MARVYEAAATKTTSAAAGFIASIVSGTKRPSILEIGIFVTTAVAGEIGLGRGSGAATVGTNALVQAMDVADTDAGTTQLTTTFTTAPSAPSVFMRRIQLPATIGAGVIWTWAPGDFLVPPSTVATAPVLWQISTAAVTYDVYVKVLE